VTVLVPDVTEAPAGTGDRPRDGDPLHAGPTLTPLRATVARSSSDARVTVICVTRFPRDTMLSLPTRSRLAAQSRSGRPPTSPRKQRATQGAMERGQNRAPHTAAGIHRRDMDRPCSRSTAQSISSAFSAPERE
jgi:hypothetical protein